MTEDQTEHVPADEAKQWFENRGLFSDHFLEARLPEWKEWQTNGELSIFRKELLSLYGSKKNILPNLNEAQTTEHYVLGTCTIQPLTCAVRIF